MLYFDSKGDLSMSLGDYERSQKVFEALCRDLDSREWKYKKDDDDFKVQFIVTGNDIPMSVTAVVQDKQQLIAFLSPLQAKYPEDKRQEGAVAVSFINNKLVDGCFDYDISDGSILFRLTNSYVDSDMGDELFSYIVDLSLTMIDEFNDLFENLTTGRMTLQELMEKY